MRRVTKNGTRTRRPPKTSRAFLLKLELRSHPRLLCVVRGALSPLMESLEFSEEQSRAIIRGVDEAVSNIMKHSYGGRPDQPIEVCCNRLQQGAGAHAERGVEIVLVDRGKAIDPTKCTGRSLDEVRPGGLGLHIIRESMDAVEYERVGRQNRLRLIKYVQPGKAPEVPKEIAPC